MLCQPGSLPRFMGKALLLGGDSEEGGSLPHGHHTHIQAGGLEKGGRTRQCITKKQPDPMPRDRPPDRQCSIPSGCCQLPPVAAVELP